jgi:uncharacterized protein YraI
MVLKQGEERMKTNRKLFTSLAWVLVSACATPPAASPAIQPTTISPPTAAIPATATIQPTATPAVLPTLPAAASSPACTPQVTADTVVNVRGGPGIGYPIVGSLNEGQAATVDGKNEDSTWWYIEYPSAPNAHGWVADSVTTSSCIQPSLTVIPASLLPTPIVAAITNAVVSVDPSEINVPGCVGKAERMQAVATIYASGPMQVQYYFEIDGFGTTRPDTLTFTQYGSRQVTQRFRPEVIAGKHTVRLWIEGLNITSWQDSTNYTITCQ